VDEQHEDLVRREMMALTPAERELATGNIQGIQDFLRDTDATNITMSDVKDMLTDTMVVLTLLVG
jgi:hypothetical protein